jgi:hypothetical protein
VVANDSDTQEAKDTTMAELFFEEVFASKAVKRVMKGLIAISIFGNIYITTFTNAIGREYRKAKSCETLLTSCAVSQTRNCKRRNFTILAILRPKHHDSNCMDSTTSIISQYTTRVEGE